MTIVVDTSAIISLLEGEADAERITNVLASAGRLLIAAPTWVELAIVTTARKGEAGYELMCELLNEAGIEVIACDLTLAANAYEAWLRFGRGRHPAGLNYGDCFSYALAKRIDAPLLYKGDDFAHTDIESALAP